MFFCCSMTNMTTPSWIDKNYTECATHCVVPENIHTPTTEGIGNSWGKYLLKTPGNAISETLIFTISLVSLALKNSCLWCEFQNCVLHIISLPLKNFLTALFKSHVIAKHGNVDEETAGRLQHTACDKQMCLLAI